MLSLSADQSLEVGIGHSDFQAAPNPRGEEAVTDWEQSLLDARNGVNKKIHGTVDNVPDFHEDFKEQINCAADLGNNIFRMSLDFGRLCPKEGVFDSALMEHYICMIGYCRKKGLKPLVTLHHWPMPKSLCVYGENGKMKNGAWEHSRIIQHFRYYIEQIIPYFLEPDKIRGALSFSKGSSGALNFTPEEIDELVDEGAICQSFITMNEPVNLYLTPYVLGLFPPYKVGQFKKGKKALKRAAEAHRIAREEFKNAFDESSEIQGIRNGVQIGVAHNIMHFEGKSWFTRWLADIADEHLNWGIIEQFEDGENDFFGVQYYFRQELGVQEALRRVFGLKPKDHDYSDHKEFGDIYPQGMKHVLHEVHDRYPEASLKVTEMGFADHKDLRRPYWIMETVRNILEAKQDGVPVDTVLLWSIINNFEWAEGMSVEFGIYDHHGQPLPTHVDDQITSVEVWSTLAKYLNKPTEENQQEVMALYEKAKTQYEGVKA